MGYTIDIYTEFGVEEIKTDSEKKAFEYAFEIMRTKVFWVKYEDGTAEFFPVRKVKYYEDDGIQ